MRAFAIPTRFALQRAPTVVRPAAIPSFVIRSPTRTPLSRVSVPSSTSTHMCQRWYCDPKDVSPPVIAIEEVRERVIRVVSSYEKVKPEKVTPEANFTKDLGVDSLDAMEIVMALEDEFGINIPDVEAERIQSVSDAIQYIMTDSTAK